MSRVRTALFASTMIAGCLAPLCVASAQSSATPAPATPPAAQSSQGEAPVADPAVRAGQTGQPDNGVASPASSAAAEPSPTQTGASAAQASGDTVGEVVVTGSRLRNTEFTSSVPIQVITAEESTLRGFANTTQIIQSATVAGNGTQINNNFTGFVVNGGPGVNTVSLRGLGADRTLVLLNGKRLGPAGAQGAVSSVDLNTIPATIIDRIEIVKDGSSSVYGSDAVAGIVNIITKQNIDGGDLHAYGKNTVDGGGGEYDVSGDFGKTFGRGYVNGSFDVYRQDPLRYGSRDYFDCAKDQAFDPTTGKSIDLTNPRNGTVKCNNVLNGVVIDAAGGGYYIPTPGSAAMGSNPAGLTRVNCTIYSNGLCTRPAGSNLPIDVAATRNSRGLTPEDGNTPYYDATAVSPVRRYTTTFSAGYDILPKYLTVYGDFLYNKRESSQNSYQQAFPIIDGANPTNPLGVLAASGLAEPVIVNFSDSRQDVDYYRGLGGVKGALPDFGTLKNWHYDVALQFSRSDASYSQDYMKLDRLNATTGPTSCNVNNVNDFLGGDSMATLEPGVACQPINWTRATQAGAFTADEQAFLHGVDTGHTTYEQSYVEGDFNGDVFELPAGAVSVDAGFHVRRDRIKDVPGPATLDGNLYNFSTSGVTRGAENVSEGFGEIGVPILRDLPLFHRLTLDVSGRYSHYDIAGDAKTYKAAVNWELTSWLGLKYDQGTSFRAPALYELYLANQTGFLAQTSIDPCINYAGKTASIVQRCAALGIPDNYVGGGSSAEVSSGGNSQNLQPETSFAKTVGVTLTPHLFGVQFAAEVDYYENKIHNTITQFGAGNILNQCYSLPTYPNAYCNLFTRDPKTFAILNVTDNYLNVGTVTDRGIDLTIRSSFKLPYNTTFRFDSQHSWTIQETTELLPGTTTDYNGTSGSPRYVGNLNFRLDRGPWTFNWFVSLVGPTSDAALISNLTTNYRGTGQPAEYLERVSFYSISNLSLRRTFGQGLTFEVGMLNAFDRQPPAQSIQDSQASRVGGVVLASQYDYYGRAVFLQVDKKF